MQSQCHTGRDFWLCWLYGYEGACALSGIGKVALIESFGVRSIVFTGVAGGIGQGVSVGDVVIARQFLKHNMDASPIFPRWEMPAMAAAAWPAMVQ